ncbi:methyltransferase family protein [Geodermatophilus sabuli]|uniref:Protein-S-isoprenylcysteine O-methyltransferase Ste14 n=1 Tax=Geodermatophilus sabuli TaxID=1564158 RepID=A0A285ECL6_9ACTN|nr:isoprenylcysteine carboxylmethyltransferase family protein [Geodermatophilus sabuli]MBB3084776.1 protein-S-isoprenylcysteine O-methyltransferase Ste14 [Geodermatophilus sabuli]SNX95816.1 Protein-S-isoprenylcysteine O-methyltransferase Ste14 [Geodermatophilus sabuli]
MTTAALVLYVLALVVLFGVRSAVQHRRTGSTGFKGISGTPAEPEWWGGVLFVVAMVAGLAGPLMAVLGVTPIDPPAALQAAGLVVALAGFAATLAAQTGMGASWRIGVDSTERTELVTSGPLFGAVRNPIFTAMVTAQAGNVLMVPTWVTVAALTALVAAVQLQVRSAEEPHLLRVHGAAYADYAARTGRFVPGIGRLTRAAAGERAPA